MKRTTPGLDGYGYTVGNTVNGNIKVTSANGDGDWTCWTKDKQQQPGTLAGVLCGGTFGCA